MAEKFPELERWGKPGPDTRSVPIRRGDLSKYATTDRIFAPEDPYVQFAQDVLKKDPTLRRTFQWARDLGEAYFRDHPGAQRLSDWVASRLPR